MSSKPLTPERSATRAVAIENAEVARIFRELADVLEVEGANSFRIRAYRNAARAVEELQDSVAAIVREDPHRLTSIPGIGEDLAGKIAEIVRTGRLAALDSEERKAPTGAVELMQIPGLGPKRARALAERLGVHSLRALADAARAGKIRTLPGFGATTEAKILEELRAHEPHEGRMLLATASQYAEQLVSYMRGLSGVERAEIAGSFRRCKETVGDLDLLVCAAPRVRVAEHFTAYHEVEEVLANGPTRCSVRLRCGLQVDLRILPRVSYGSGLYYFTGSKAHNIAIRALGRKRGLKINEYGVFRGARRIGGSDEADVLDAVGLPWIPPELREDRGEIEAAREGTLPTLVEASDIRGDLQSHTTDSDGRDTLDAMAEAAQALGYEYLAVTDHTPSVRVARGLDRAGFRQQMRRIDRLNARLRSLTVLKGAEVDIRLDGTLDLDDETLAALDIVFVAVHSHFELAPEAQTRRLLRAITHPHVDVLGHPTGRLIGKRRGELFDLHAVCAAAAEHGVMLEVDAQPDRLDLDDVACRAAIDQGVRIVIDTDAHATAELGFMRWGIAQARRGWAQRRHVANTLPLERLRKLLHGGRG
ncbi:MAG TPA: DNA polymerase/3'-5' exonuclease PolX [Gemmatimonadaceae bacterium]